MECVAKYDFNATQADELSFRKQQTLYVINVHDDKNWCRAECDGRVGLIPRNYVQFAENSWYQGKISRVKAENNLREDSCPQGAFLVRDSENNPGGFSLSVKCADGIQHYKILKSSDRRFHIWDEPKFISINSLIAHHRTHSVSQTQHILLIDVPETFSVRAAFDFHRQEAGELEFRKGDIITVTEFKDKNWWSGSLQGQVGIFPSNYVEIPADVKMRLGLF